MNGFADPRHFKYPHFPTYGFQNILMCREIPTCTVAKQFCVYIPLHVMLLIDYQGIDPHRSHTGHLCASGSPSISAKVSPSPPRKSAHRSSHSPWESILGIIYNIKKHVLIQSWKEVITLKTTKCENYGLQSRKWKLKKACILRFWSDWYIWEGGFYGQIDPEYISEHCGGTKSCLIWKCSPAHYRWKDKIVNISFGIPVDSHTEPRTVWAKHDC